MRILFDYRPALRHRTGVGQYAHHLAAAVQPLLGPADSLTLFSSSWKDRLPSPPVAGAAHVDLRIPVRALNFAWHRLGWPKADSLVAGTDVTHSMHPLLMPTRSAACVVTIHDLFFLDNPGETSAEIRRDYPALAARHARRADGVIVVSEYTRAAAIERLGVDAERITVCPSGAPAWPVRPEPRAPGPFLFIGTIEPRKNLPGLLAGYERLSEQWADAPPLVVAGKADPSQVSRLVARISPRALANVRFCGYVTDEERLRLYREAVALVVPSLDEGFGLPALEAMTIGLPVIASRRGALPEVLGDAAVFVEPDDPGQIARAMRAVAGDSALRRRLVAAGARQAARYRWDTSARRLVEAYRRAIERRRGRP